MEWRRVWLVTTRVDGPESRREQVATTAAELRRLIHEARTDSTVWHWRYESRRELAGDKPTHCECGAEFRTAGSGATPHEWLACRCGGHFWWGCACGRVRVEPVVAYDCKPRWPR